MSDSTVLDETWVLARAGNKPLYAFALLWMLILSVLGTRTLGITHTITLVHIKNQSLEAMKKNLKLVF